MKDRELEQLLKGARLPEREERYWERFPGQVLAKIQERAASNQASQRATSALGQPPHDSLAGLFATMFGRLRAKPVFALALVVACLGLSVVFGPRKPGPASATEPPLAAARKYYQELETLFPNQIRAVIFDAHGPRLDLADKANLPASPPLFLRIWGPQGSQEFVTFSGQSIHINGERCEVLLDHAGDVLLVGERTVWSSSDPHAKAGAYRVEAEPLYKTS